MVVCDGCWSCVMVIGVLWWLCVMVVELCDGYCSCVMYWSSVVVCVMVVV